MLSGFAIVDQRIEKIFPMRITDGSLFAMHGERVELGEVWHHLNRFFNYINNLKFADHWNKIALVLLGLVARKEEVTDSLLWIITINLSNYYIKSM